MNIVGLLGNLGKDPEMRYAPNGTAICSFSIAVNRAGGREEDGWFDVVCFGPLAESCSQYLSKGARVVVQGSLQQDRWQDKETGAQRSAVKVKAFTVDFPPKSEREGGLRAETSEGESFFGDD